MNLHILGICGTLMGSIALLARELGHHVTGTDENVYPPMSTQLESAGIPVEAGYTAHSIPPDTELVILGNANLPRGNPALEAVLDAGLRYTSGAEWLSRYLLADRWVIAVAGTHGKTTTTAMISWILEYAGLDPGFLVGGVPANFGRSSKLGSAPFFVIEADEYDTSYFDRRSKFLHYRPRTLVLNNLEFDHADIFPDLDAIKTQFHLLLRSVPGKGLIIHPAADRNLQDVIARGCWSPRLATGDGAVRAGPSDGDGSAFPVIVNGDKQGEVRWSLTGEHNVSNALSAIAAARHAGVAAAVGCEALCNFRGVKRRMELIHDSGTVRIYDDFAHHPTAIRTTLEGLRKKVANERILAIVEPASHTMKLGTHQASLARSVQAADETIWFQPQGVGWDMGRLRAGNASLAGDLEQLTARVAGRVHGARQPLHIVIMSNGAFMGFHGRLLEAIAKGEG